MFLGKVLEAKIDKLENYFLTVLEKAGGYNPSSLSQKFQIVFWFMGLILESTVKLKR